MAPLPNCFLHDACAEDSNLLGPKSALTAEYASLELIMAAGNILVGSGGCRPCCANKVGQRKDLNSSFSIRPQRYGI